MAPASRPSVQPRSRHAWRAWLAKHHASSAGVWLIYAKKQSGIPSLSYDDAVEEALCFGWIDSKIQPIDSDHYRQMFTPRNPKSAWSALNKARVERLIASGSMTKAGAALVTLARQTGRWDALASVETLTVPPDLQEAIDADPRATKHWPAYSAGMRKGFLYKLSNAKRPETRARYIQEIVGMVARNMSRAELLARSGFAARKRTSARPKAAMRAKGS